jgi:hypothetical protein
MLFPGITDVATRVSWHVSSGITDGGMNLHAAVSHYNQDSVPAGTEYLADALFFCRTWDKYRIRQSPSHVCHAYGLISSSVHNRVFTTHPAFS